EDATAAGEHGQHLVADGGPQVPLLVQGAGNLPPEALHDALDVEPVRPRVEVERPGQLLAEGPAKVLVSESVRLTGGDVSRHGHLPSSPRNSRMENRGALLGRSTRAYARAAPSGRPKRAASRATPS